MGPKERHYPASGTKQRQMAGCRFHVHLLANFGSHHFTRLWPRNCSCSPELKVVLCPSERDPKEIYELVIID